ncbi:PREDICTED: RNA polymerase I-specific transcription initiation factor RRN3 [Dinoponera quadriceps]|uniref:RNA polymerase I-specific transcription initiation factor RRN3 n=1 Tax=Dinoponera quadriceps TaxID=609295 RepID=A0A6P3X6E2_DINQU|nr:PREDICTED: RNA polymerase I-specific transcription initiation factor RRN3 [Dinoponera quadriceps]XP_014473821.1 PREDICTED: RNA polymerase I-specific transcription initiation factor RRN3 [Dinoponera quadriceps]
MSVTSSRVTSLSNIIRDVSKITNQPNRIYYRPPKGFRHILCGCKFDTKKEYEGMISSFREGAIKDSDLVNFLEEIRQYITLLDCEHKMLVQTLLEIKWTDKSPDLISTYKAFIEDLVCARVEYARTVFDHLVKLFKPVVEDNREHKDKELTLQDTERLNHIHDMLSKILKVVPMSRKCLLYSIESQYPYITHSTYIHEVYLHGLLYIPYYAPYLRSDIISIVINSLALLDVNITMRKTKGYQELYDMIDNTNDDPATANNDADKAEHVQLIECTLDMCMDIFMEFIHKFCFINPIDLNKKNLKILYHDILTAFDKVLLRVDRTQYVQYIGFYFCSFKSVVEPFIDYLWKKVTDWNEAPVIRQSAVFYMSSLAASASFITSETLKSTIYRLTDWIHDYIGTDETSDSYVDLKLNNVFYSVCQAFFYLFVARYEELVRTRCDILFIQQFDIPRIISCKLNPLVVCDSKIVRNFANITKMYQLAYCDAIIEDNARKRLPIFGEQELLLPTFFPFESCVLERSKSRIAPLLISNETNNASSQLKDSQ